MTHVRSLPAHARSLSLLAAGAILGAATTLALPRAGAQESPAALPDELRGEVSLFQGEARLAGRVTELVQLGDATFLRVQTGGAPRWLNVESVTAIVPGK